MFFNSNNQALHQTLLREKSCFVIDLDGVVYRGKQMIAGASAAIQKFREAGKNIAFLTNNSASSTDAILHKLHGFSIACDRQEILTAAQASAMFIAQHQIDQGKGVFAIGTEALKAEVVDHGLKLADPDNCGAVLVGLDPKFDYAAINMALRAIASGASLVACNRDANFPVESGHLMAGCGAMVAAIEAATGHTADFEIGKPNTFMLDILIDRMQISLADCLVIGDMLASDILMANNANIPSIWISEMTTYPNEVPNSPQPSLLMSSLDEISKVI
jgi:HAD superfamily hydrolase (TIGR01450 family)